MNGFSHEQLVTAQFEISLGELFAHFVQARNTEILALHQIITRATD